MARHPDPFDRRSMWYSVAVHGLLLLVGWLSTLSRPTPMEFITYEVELVSPPPTQQAEVEEMATEEVVVETPDPTPPPPPEPEPEQEEVPIEDPDDPPPPEEESQPTEQLAEESTEATTTEEPTEEATESGEDINVRMEGLRRDFPAYYGNITRQIRRCFRPPRDGRDWTTTVFFFIERDGSVKDIDFVDRSGSFDFDFAAMGAIECAGTNGRFGPLPEDLPYDRLPIQFEFKPVGDPVGLFPQNGRPAEGSEHE